jgi:hypothetical protein
MSRCSFCRNIGHTARLCPEIPNRVANFEREIAGLSRDRLVEKVMAQNVDMLKVLLRYKRTITTGTKQYLIERVIHVYENSTPPPRIHPLAELLPVGGGHRVTDNARYDNIVRNMDICLQIISNVERMPQNEFVINILNKALTKLNRLILLKQQYTRPRIQVKCCPPLTDLKECPVCWEETQDRVITDCKHELCSPCFQTMMKQTRAVCCPMCRNSIQSITCTNIAPYTPTPIVSTPIVL